MNKQKLTSQKTYFKKQNQTCPDMHGYIQTAIHSAAELTLEKTTYFFYTYSFLNRSFHTPPPQKKN